MLNLGVPNANPCTNFAVKSGLSVCGGHFCKRKCILNTSKANDKNLLEGLNFSQFKFKIFFTSVKKQHVSMYKCIIKVYLKLTEYQ